MLAALDAVAHELGRGLVAGAAGTAAMTASSTAEMRIRRRAPSAVPAQAAGKALRVQPLDDPATGRLATAAHVSTGVLLGVPRAVIGAAGLRGLRALAAYLPIAAAPDFAVVPAMGVGVPPPWRWGAREVAISALHHAAYAAAASATYDALSAAARRRP
jgi:hypothetical protein